MDFPPEAKEALPGVVGAALTWPRLVGVAATKILFVVGGATAAFYGSDFLAHLMGTPNAKGLYGFAIGLFSMTLVNKAFDAISAIDASTIGGKFTNWIVRFFGG